MVGIERVWDATPQGIKRYLQRAGPVFHQCLLGGPDGVLHLLLQAYSVKALGSVFTWVYHAEGAAVQPLHKIAQHRMPATIHQMKVLQSPRCCRGLLRM